MQTAFRDYQRPAACQRLGQLSCLPNRARSQEVAFLVGSSAALVVMRIAYRAALLPTTLLGPFTSHLWISASQIACLAPSSMSKVPSLQGAFLKHHTAPSQLIGHRLGHHQSHSIPAFLFQNHYLLPGVTEAFYCLMCIYFKFSIVL